MGSAGIVLLLVAFLVLNLPARVSEQAVVDAVGSDFDPDPHLGEHLFHLAGCGDCHLNREPDEPIFGTLAGGAPLQTPIGYFVPPNITPDMETGIGEWSDTDFVNALTRGTGPDGQHYYAAFPYPAYAVMSIEDILHIKEYLFTTEPVNFDVGPNNLVFPFNLRLGNLFWKALFFDPASFEADPTRSDEWNRGAYLVNGIGHCGSCHTPRNLLFAEKPGQEFYGADPLKEGEKPAPRLAGLDPDSILNGLDEWSGAISENSSMYLVTQAFSIYADPSDRDAVATYLSSLPNE